jgi:flagellar basal-body rod modification protein FlgD
MTSAISSVTPTITSSSASRIPSKQLTPDDYLKLIVSEMSQQDPLKPSDSSKVAEQVMNMGNFQSLQTMTTDMAALKVQQGQLLGYQMVGKEVDMRNAVGGTDRGIVQSVRELEGDYLLTVNGIEYKMSSLLSVHQPTLAPQP